MNSQFLNNGFLKLSALALAIVAYVYIRAELKESPGTLPQALARDYLAKSIPVRVDLFGKPAKGFEVKKEKIVTEPEKVMLIGPQNLVESIEYLETQPIYVGRRTGTIKVRTGLKITSGIGGMEQQTVDVIIPIERIKK